MYTASGWQRASRPVNTAMAAEKFAQGRMWGAPPRGTDSYRARSVPCYTVRARDQGVADGSVRGGRGGSAWQESASRRTRRAGVLASGAFVAMLLVLVAFPTARADPTPTLTIQTPVPSGTTSEGPVGANVTINGQGFTPSDTLVIGYASVDQGCTAGNIPLSPQVSVPAGGDGSFTSTFAWPSSAANIGASYYVCITDSTTPGATVQSTQQYKVDASAAPSITLTPGMGPNDATPVAGQTAFIIGGQIALTASNYQPGGKALTALLLTSQYTQPADLTGSSVVTLATADSSTQLMADAERRAHRESGVAVLAGRGHLLGLPHLHGWLGHRRAVAHRGYADHRREARAYPDADPLADAHPRARRRRQHRVGASRSPRSWGWVG